MRWNRKRMDGNSVRGEKFDPLREFERKDCFLRLWNGMPCNFCLVTCISVRSRSVHVISTSSVFTSKVITEIQTGSGVPSAPVQQPITMKNDPLILWPNEWTGQQRIPCQWMPLVGDGLSSELSLNDRRVWHPNQQCGRTDRQTTGPTQFQKVKREEKCIRNCHQVSSETSLQCIEEGGHNMSVAWPAKWQPIR